MNKSRIEWTDFTWNPVTGCTNGCSYCYARRMSHRLAGRAGYPKDEPFAPTFHLDKLLEPLALKTPAKIFTCSMGDLFDPKVPELWQDLILRVMRECPQHTFLVLTKRPDMIPHMNEEFWPSNLWLGVSIDGENNGAELLDDLFDSEFPFSRFVSFEPLLGPISDLDALDIVQWIIIGAQTGPGAQQPENETQYGWVWDIVNAAKTKNIPVFIKNNLRWRENTGVHLQQFPKEVH